MTSIDALRALTMIDGPWSIQWRRTAAGLDTRDIPAEADRIAYETLRLLDRNSHIVYDPDEDAERGWYDAATGIADAIGSTLVLTQNDAENWAALDMLTDAGILGPEVGKVDGTRDIVCPAALLWLSLRYERHEMMSEDAAAIARVDLDKDDDLVDSAQIAAIIGMTVESFRASRSRGAGKWATFPEPDTQLSGGPVWRWHRVFQWWGGATPA